jgi:hypothetical protein
MLSRSEKAVKYFGDIRYPKIEKIILEWAAKQPDPYIALVNYLQTGKQEPIKSKIITPRRLDSCGIYWEFGRAMTELKIEDVAKIAKGMGYGPSYLKLMLDTYRNFPEGVPEEVKNTKILTDLLKEGQQTNESVRQNAANVPVKKDGLTDEIARKNSIEELVKENEPTGEDTRQNVINRPAKIFKYFRNLAFPKVEESVLEWAVEQPDPYIALIRYLMTGKKEPVESEKITLQRDDSCGIYWEFGRAIAATKCVTARVARAAGHTPTYMRYMHHVYNRFPQGIPEDIKSTVDLRKRMAISRKDISIKKDGKGASKNIEEGSVEILYKEDSVNNAIKELSNYANTKGKPVPNKVIDEIAIKHGISPNGLKNYWGAYCRNTIHPTVQVIIQMMAEKIAAYEAKITELQAANKEHENKIQELQASNKAIENKVQELQTYKSALEAQVSQSEQKLNEYKEKIKAFMSMFNNLKEQFSVAV